MDVIKKCFELYVNFLNSKTSGSKQVFDIMDMDIIKIKDSLIILHMEYLLTSPDLSVYAQNELQAYNHLIKIINDNLKNKILELEDDLDRHKIVLEEMKKKYEKVVKEIDEYKNCVFFTIDDKNDPAISSEPNTGSNIGSNTVSNTVSNTGSNIESNIRSGPKQGSGPITNALDKANNWFKFNL